MPPYMRRAWRAALRCTVSSPNEYRSTDAPIVLFMTCAPLCPGGDNRQREHDYSSQAIGRQPTESTTPFIQGYADGLLDGLDGTVGNRVPKPT